MPTAREVAAWIQAELTGDPDVEVRDVNAIDGARAGDAVYALDAKRLAAAEQTPAAVVLVPRNLASSLKTLLRTDDPRVAFATLVDRFRPPDKPLPGIHASASVARDARVAKTASVGAFAVVEAGAQVGERAAVGAGCVLGPRSAVGDDTVLCARVTVYHDCRIGARGLVHSGVVIGSDGFGFAQDPKGRHVKIRQIGNVEIGDDVEIGANTAIDRATFGSTTVGDGTKIDNLCHIGHNCRIGKHVLLAAQVGLSGSIEIGDHAILLGQVGVKDHLRIGARAIVLPQSGLSQDVPEGTVWFGSPALPRMQREREFAALHRLPELLKRVSRIERKLGTDGAEKERPTE